MSGKRILWALAEGNSEASNLASLVVSGVKASPKQLTDALVGASQMTSRRRRLLQLFLERLQLIDSQIDTLERDLADVLREHQDAVTRLGQVPGFGVESAHQIIAEVGPQAASFPSAGHLASWVGCSPGREESAEKSKSDRSPRGSSVMRRILNQAAHAAVKAKGSVFQDFYHRIVTRLGRKKAIWAVAHKLCRIAWKVLHDGITYQERGARPDPITIHRRISKLFRELRRLGYQLQPTPTLTATQGDAA